MDSRLPRILFGSLVLYAVVHFSFYYPRLPGVIASHFDARGVANGWQSKQAFFGVFAGVTALFVILIFLLPWITTMIPPAFINLPNKAHWLSPERRVSTQRFLSAWSAWFGCAVFFVVVVAYDYAVKSNLPFVQSPSPEPLWYALGGLGVFTLAALVWIWIRFGRPPSVSR